MKISTEIIKKLNPCTERFNNYLKHYEDFSGTLQEFLNLDKITYDDKVWVFTKITTKKQIIKWGILCAESVLHIFEKEYPYDKRPFLALQAAKNYLINPSEENKKTAADAAYAAYAADATAYAVGVHTDTATKVKQQNLNLQLMLEAIK